MTIEYNCSCGDSFGTAAELIEHARTDHGVDVE